ncbi:CocE/NonD family hydrolase [Dactylosporangium aurantiacum]|uniref:CocE/NonD family hydrolase n=1 Tax=Dactylosporangium aurantiacum TaxID=35754 RepID=A0A9Q9IS77_9ACTN|nr:CocE/NonD family hydrolase [Dactylosporangium aurantiacum]MDG6110509.1 CocE/NonD family hydrolase [Dactylosporangium aurantiacum]UWZ58425.1 CocE/NonD family hydrolase [Dactylosporangium aurantiacum]
MSVDAPVSARAARPARRRGEALAARLAAGWWRLPVAGTPDVRVTTGLRIPMRDGVELIAEHYAPVHGSGLPTLLVRNPYGWQVPVGLLYGRLYAERGFQVVVQRCRGTFGSEGTFEPWADETADGQDTVEWLLAQPWCSGEFATIGPSYLAYAQWALGRDGTPAGLGGLVSQLGPHEYRGVAFPGGAFALDTMLGWAAQLTQVKRGPVRDNLRQLAERRRLNRIAYRRLPLVDSYREALRRDIPYFERWLRHAGAGDPFWDRFDRTAAVAATSAPVLLQSGWHDVFLPHVLEQYRILRAAGREPALTIGPWTHTGLLRSWPELFGDSLDWLRGRFGQPGAAVRSDPVRVFVPGEDRWRGYREWPPPGIRQRPWYLQPGRGLAPVPPPRSEPDTYVYDPARPTPAVGGAWVGPGAGPVDNRRLERRADVLVYSGPVLDQDLLVTGPVRVELFVSSSRAHTDFFARLCDVSPSGHSVNVCDGLVRVGPEEPVDAAGVRSLTVQLGHTAWRFRAGHRVRLQVSSGAHPRFARNHGTGEPLATATTLLTAEQSVHHDPSCPSALILPIA